MPNHPHQAPTEQERADAPRVSDAPEASTGHAAREAAEPTPPTDSSAERRAAGSPGPRGRAGRGLALAVAAAVVVAAWVGFADSDEPASETNATGPLPVAVQAIEMRDDFEVRDRLAGRLTSGRRSELGFDRGGRIASVAVDEGDRVEAGALLASLDTRELEAQRREQRARRNATRARLDLARATAGRQRRLAASGTISNQTLDEAVANEASLDAQLAADRAALQRTEVALELSRLEAPYPAIVVRRHLDEGSVAMPGTPLLSLIEDGGREVRVGVPPEVATNLEPGRRYRVESEGVALEATLRDVLPELDRATRTRPAIFEIDPETDAPGRVADGALVWVEVTRAVPTRGAWVPIGALAEGRRGTWTLFALRDDETGTARVERRVVEIVHTEGEQAFVRGTIGAGDRIVADGLHRLIPGLAVEPVLAAVAAGGPGHE